MNHAENQMFNWSRDFIQTHTSKHGFCEDRKYRRIFRLFQRYTAMKENPLIFSRYCKKWIYFQSQQQNHMVVADDR